MRKRKTTKCIDLPCEICSKTKLCCGYFFLGPLPRSFFKYIFWTRMFQERQVSLKKKTRYLSWFPHFWPQSMSTTRSFWVVCARNSRTERTHTHSLSYTLHIFTPYICWIPLMKHECWDRVVASLKPVKGQIVDVQEWSRTLVTCSFRQNHVSLYCVVVLNSKDDLLAIAWPCQPDIHETTNGLKAKTHDILSQFLIYVRLLF